MDAHRLGGRVAGAALLLLVFRASLSPLPAQPLPRELVTSTGLRLHLLLEEARHPAWSARGEWIAFDRAGERGFSQLWVARSDGSQARCLTCRHYDLRKLHCGLATWHPSGEFLVFLAEEPFAPGGEPVPYPSAPGRNRGSELWAISFDGSSLFRLTHLRERGGRALPAHFSHEGDRLVWTQRIASGGGLWGRWSIVVAPFTTRHGVAAVGKLRQYRPGEQRRFYEVYGFTPSDKSVLLSGNLDPGQAESGLDLWELTLESGDLLRLTDDPERWDRYGRLSPDGARLAWSSDRGSAVRSPVVRRDDLTVETALDLWLGPTRAPLPRQLTHFADPLHPDSLGRVSVRAAGWSRGGDQLLVAIEPLAGTGAGSVYLLELPPLPSAIASPNASPTPE